MKLPLVQLVRQIAPQPTVPDVPAAVRRAWLESPLARRIRPGMRIAVGCGSRGIKNYLALAKATIDVLKELGAEPFVVAAMGSHGGATSEGQRELLASYSIDEAHLGVPIITDMDAVSVGTNSWGQPVWWDRNALTADGVVLLNRVKPHTDFRGAYESGLAKMAVIGLGKQRGADQVHSFGTRGLREMLVESLKIVLDKTPLLGGLAVLENAREETGHLEVLAKEDILAKEPPLLEKARAMMGRLPFHQLDCLIVGECGKNYSGAGLDPNVVGRLLIEASPEMELAGADPRITRIGVLDVSPESHGNATGIGIADLTTSRALAAIDPVPFRMNNLTARCLWRSKLPIGFETDRECIQQCVETCWQPEFDKLRFAIIPNTLEVVDLWVSPVVAAEARVNASLSVEGEVREIPFDAAGQLKQEQLFPHSVRGRRASG
jgi:hypothetical protein